MRSGSYLGESMSDYKNSKWKGLLGGLCLCLQGIAGAKCQVKQCEMSSVKQQGSD